VDYNNGDTVSEVKVIWDVNFLIIIRGNVNYMMVLLKCQLMKMDSVFVRMMKTHQYYVKIIENSDAWVLAQVIEYETTN
jgi:hypothetical protein